MVGRTISKTSIDLTDRARENLVRESFAKWAVILAVVLIDAVLVMLGGYHFLIVSLAGPAFLCSIVLPAAWLCLLGQRAELFVLFDTVAQISFFTFAGATLSFLAFTTNFPLIDQTLSAIDRTLGFDWNQYVSWIQARPLLNRWMGIAYFSWGPEWLIIVVFLAYRHEKRVRELSAAALISILVTIFVSALWPALGADPNSSWIPDVMALRDGSFSTFDLLKADGMVSFPSFHVIGALLFIYSLRGLLILFPVGLLWNAFIIAATPPWGAHYLVDGLGGGVVALGAIFAARSLTHAFDYHRDGAPAGFVFPPPVSTASPPYAADAKDTYY